MKRKPTVAIIGAGRLGTALARALASHGYKVEAVMARTIRHARRCAELVGTHPLALASAQLDQLPASDILFITTPDDAITEVAAELAATIGSHTGKVKSVGKGKGNRGRTVLHASGALSSAALQSLRDAGFATGSMHPLVSVSDPLQGAKSLGAAFFCVEGSVVAVRVARSVVLALGGQSFSISAGDKALYHAAAVMASGHTTALFDIAMEMLVRCGLAPRRARAVLLPLLRSTLENLYTQDPAHALTGTFARADKTTVGRHLTALRSRRMEDALAAYMLLGRRSLQLAKAAGVSPDALKEIARALAKSAKM
ncbi:MAG: hypothetical protein QOH25_1359 [Acidobacteriota bacterium]|nr:hypothetical protein [Acidobacteriota bacterium]